MKLNVFRKFKQCINIALVMSLMLSALSGAFALPVQASSAGDNVVISQVYGGGGNSGAPYKNDFIELYNPTGNDIVLDNWTIQYAGSTGAQYTPESMTVLSGTIHAYGYYLIKEAAGAGNGEELPPADVSGNIAMAAGSGKVALVKSNTALSASPGSVLLLDNSDLVDFVGYGSANQSEKNPTAALANAKAAIRKATPSDNTASTGKGAGQDSDDNSLDFVVTTPNPRNSSIIETPFAAGELPHSVRPVGENIQFSGVTVTGYDGAVKASVTVSVYSADPSTETVPEIARTQSTPSGAFSVDLTGTTLETANTIYLTSTEPDKQASFALQLNRAQSSVEVSEASYLVENSSGTVSGTTEAAGSLISVYADAEKTQPLTATSGALSVASGPDKKFTYKLSSTPNTIYVTQVTYGGNGRSLESEPVAVQKLDLSVITPIHDIRTVDSKGSSEYTNGKIFTIEGVVTVDNNVFGTGANYYFIQDDTAGILIYGGTSLGSSIVKGDRLKITGTILEYYGLLEFQPLQIERTGVEQSLPQFVPITVTDLSAFATAEPLEGMRVQLNAVVTNVPSTSGSVNVTVKDPNSTKTTTVRVLQGAGIDLTSTLQKDRLYTITGIVGQYDSSSPYTSGYQLMPASASDITPLLGITHTPIKQAYVDADVTLTAIADAAEQVILYYRSEGDAAYTPLTMSVSDSSTYSVVIPAETIGTRNFQYYIEAVSGENKASAGTAGTPYAVIVLDDTTGPEFGTPTPAQNYRQESYRPKISLEISDLSGVDTSTIVMKVDGVSVDPVITTGAILTLVAYTPATEMTLGSHTVMVSAKDSKQNENSFTWSFEVVEPFTGGNQYAGTTHNHTNVSHDADGEPVTAVEESKKYGYDWFAFSDHSHDIDSAQVDKDTVTNSGGMPERTGGEKWNLEKQLAEQYTEDGKFVVFPAFEATSTTWGHSNVFNTENFIDRKQNGGLYQNLNQYYAWVLTQDQAIAQFNHPDTPAGSFNGFTPYNKQVDELFTMSEVGNGSGHYAYYNMEDTYFKALDLGWHLAPTYGEDNHDATWGQTLKRTIIVSKDLTPDSLLDSMRKMRVYMTEDPNFRMDFSANGQYMGAVVEGNTLNFSVSGHDDVAENKTMAEYNFLSNSYVSNDTIAKVELLSNGKKVIDSIEPNSTSFEWHPSVAVTSGQQWYMIRVTQKDGERAYSSPIWSQVVPVDVKVSGIEVVDNALVGNTPTNIKIGVSNAGTEALSNLTVDLYYDSKDAEHKLGSAAVNSIEGNSVAYVTVPWSNPVSGEHKLIAVVSSPDGDDPLDNTYELSVKVKEPLGLTVMIDAAHKNENTTTDIGTYVDKLQNFTSMVRQEGYNVVENKMQLTTDVLKDVKVLMISHPNVDLTSEEKAAVTAFVKNGGALFMTEKSNYGANPAINNNLLAEIGSHIQVSNDGIYDDSSTGNFWSTPATAKFAVRLFPQIVDNYIMDRVPPIEYYSGASLYKLGTSGPEPLTTEDNVTVLAFANETSYQNSVKAPSYTYDTVSDASGGSVIPAIASEQVGSGRVIVSGMNVVNDQQWDDAFGDNGNNDFGMNAINWLAGRETKVSDIGAVRTLPDGSDAVVQGVVTSAAGVFFDAFYLQDATGGIMAFKEVKDDSLKLGDIVRVYGSTHNFEGNREIIFDEFSKDVVIVGHADPAEPKSIHTGDSEVIGYQGLLVKVTGKVLSKYDSNSYIIDDGSGPMIVFTDGYITNQSGPVPELQAGDTLEAVGILGGFAEGSRIRVRDTRELKKVGSTESPDSEAALSGLLMKDKDGNAVSYTPLFSGETLQYTTTVLNKVDTVKVYPSAAAGALAMIKVNGAGISSDGYAEVALAAGVATTITIQVTAEDGTTVKTYLLKVTRQSADSASGGSSGNSGGDSSNGDNASSSGGTTAPGSGSTGEKTTNLVDTDKMSQALSSAASTQVQIDMGTQGQITITSDALGLFLNQSKVQQVILQNAQGQYTLTPEQINWSKLEKQLGVTKEKLSLNLSITANATASRQATNAGMNVIGATAFTLTAMNPAGQSQNIQQLDKYANHQVSVSKGTDTGHLAVLRVDQVNGKTVFTPVPFTLDGNNINIYSRTNGSYVLVQHTASFNDTMSHWARQEIEALAGKYIIQGINDKVFEPNRSITRAEFTALMIRMFGLSVPDTEGSSFKDVSNTSWYAPYITSATEAGLIKGYTGSQFKPEQTISREEMAVIISRGFALAGYDTSSTTSAASFADGEQIQNWAKSAVGLLNQYEIVKGNPDGSFKPKGSATRAESAAMLGRLSEMLKFNP
ncbi:S-layer homology domain-containing protein [Paenibacillus sp. F6_3S_P_1C]|uniref:S-layer homology domain-containing protein n=1 Tax=Paenibacillus vandeheii TaxID=3035917 RepID=A0ABT8JHF3_9BACL|nr:S-layer homology domain-containing protein [Paenibacillus vandeheii]MDN4604504.1 S-layer homology domain-containing protein [Paenibacillus vandeheii]